MKKNFLLTSEKIQTLNNQIILGNPNIFDELIKLDKKIVNDIESKLEIKRLIINYYVSKAIYREVQKQSDELFQISKEKNLPKFQFYAIIGKIEVAESLNNIENAFKLIKEAETILKENNEIKDSIDYLALFYLKSGLIYHKAYLFEKSINYFKKILLFKNKISNFVLIADTHTNLGVVYHLQKKYKKAIEHYKKSLEIGQKLESNITNAWTYAHISWAYFHSGQINKVLENALKSKSIAQKCENEHCEDFATFIIANYYNFTGNIQKAIENIELSLNFRKKRGNPLEIAYAYANVANFNSIKGDLDIALINIEKALEIPQAIEDPIAFPYLLILSGKILAEHGKYKDSNRKLLEAYNHFTNITNVVDKARCLHYLISNSIIMENPNKTMEYLDNLEKLSRENIEISYLKYIFQLNKAIILKNKRRIVDKISAQLIFEEISNNEEVDSEIFIDAMVNLIELLIVEFELSGNENSFSEMKKVTNKIYSIAEKQNSFSLLCETLVFQAKIKIYELDFSKSQELFIKAQSIASNKGFIKLAKKISDDHDKMLSYIEHWSKIDITSISTKERIKTTKFNFIFSKMIRNFKELPRIKDEKPYFLTIWSDSGFRIFNMLFEENDSESKKEMLSDFLLALNNFGKKILNSTGHIDRIKHGEYTIIIKDKQNLLFGYAFKGSTYSATQKIEFLIDKIYNSKNIWNQIIHSEESKLMIDLSNKEKIHEMINEIFKNQRNN